MWHYRKNQSTMNMKSAAVAVCKCWQCWRAKPTRRNLLSFALFCILISRNKAFHFHVPMLHESFTSCREEAVAEQRQHRSVSTCGRSTEGGDWLQRHAQMERSPPSLTGSQRAICSAEAIVRLCIKLFYVPHEFTASLKLSWIAGGGHFMRTVEENKGSFG